MDEQQRGTVNQRNILDTKLNALYGFIKSDAFHKANDTVQEVINEKYSELVLDFDYFNRIIRGFKIEIKEEDTQC